MDATRNDFRISFPPSMSAFLEVKGQKYMITNLSANGVKVKFELPLYLEKDQTVDGNIVFSDKTSSPVQGKIHRIEEKSREIAITFTKNKGVPLKKMMEVHRKIIKRRKNLTT